MCNSGFEEYGGKPALHFNGLSGDALFSRSNIKTAHQQQPQKQKSINPTYCQIHWQYVGLIDRLKFINNSKCAQNHDVMIDKNTKK